MQLGARETTYCALLEKETPQESDSGLLTALDGFKNLNSSDNSKLSLSVKG